MREKVSASVSNSVLDVPSRYFAPRLSVFEVGDAPKAVDFANRGFDARQGQEGQAHEEQAGTWPAPWVVKSTGALESCPHVLFSVRWPQARRGRFMFTHEDISFAYPF